MKADRAFGQIRKAQGIYLEQAAVHLGLSAGYLRSLERGKFPLNLHLAEQMCHYYGVDLNELTRYPYPATGNARHPEGMCS